LKVWRFTVPNWRNPRQKKSPKICIFYAFCI
jgi:hypothetical protein